jgi:hypothetical protein
VPQLQGAPQPGQPAWHSRNYTSLRNNLSKERAEMLIFVKANMANSTSDADR